MSQEQKEEKKATIAIKKKGDTLAFLERKDPLRTNANLYVPSNSNPFLVATNNINTNAFAKATTVNTLSSLLSSFTASLGSIVDARTQTLAISNIAPSGSNVGDSTIDPTQSVSIQLASTINLFAQGNGDGAIKMDTVGYNLRVRSSMYIYGPSVVMSSALTVQSLTTDQVTISNMSVANLGFSTLTGSTTSSLITVSTVYAFSNLSTSLIEADEAYVTLGVFDEASTISFICDEGTFSTMRGTSLTVSTLSTLSTGFISSLTTNTLSIHSSLVASSITTLGSSIFGQCNTTQVKSNDITTSTLNVTMTGNITQLSSNNTSIISSLTAPLISTTQVSSVSGVFEISLHCAATATAITFSGGSVIGSTMEASVSNTTPIVKTMQILPIVAGDPITFKTLNGSTIHVSTLNTNITDETEGYFSTLYSNNTTINTLQLTTLKGDVTFDKLIGPIAHVSTLNRNLTDETEGYMSTFYSNTVFTTDILTSTIRTDHIQPSTTAGTITFERLSGDYLHLSTLNKNLTDNTTGFFSTLHTHAIQTDQISSNIAYTDNIQPNVTGSTMFSKLSGTYVSTTYLSTSQISVGDTTTSNVYASMTSLYINGAPVGTQAPQLPIGSVISSLKININGLVWRIPIQYP